MLASSRAVSRLRTTITDIRLVHLAKSGDALAFINLYDTHVGSVYRYIYFLVPNSKIAEGLTLQVFFKAWEILDQYRIFDAPFISWLYSIANDRVNAYYNTHKGTVGPEDDFMAAVRGANFREEFQIIRDNLRLVTAEQQQIMVLKFIAGMSNGQIERVMKSRAGNIGVSCLLGLQALAERLNKTELRIDDIEEFQYIVDKCLKRLSKGESALECLARYPEYIIKLLPLLEAASLLYVGCEAGPSPRFVEYTRNALTQYIWTHPRRKKIIVAPAFQRMVFTFAMLAAVFLATGTAHAQSALPGDAFYPLKRASERAWLMISPDPVATNIILTERRLNEWVAVSNDSTLSTTARFNYLEALTQLESATDLESLPQVMPALELQQQALDDVGLVVNELDNYLAEAMTVLDETDATIQSPSTTIVSAAAPSGVPTQAVLAQTDVPTENIPVEVEVPTEVVPIETMVPTEIVPTASAIPTEAVATDTGVPTEVAVTGTEVVAAGTEVPTEVVAIDTEVPVETESPTEVVPAETEAPTEIVPIETVVPIEPVPIPTP